jgi:hypothetical protein
MKKTSDAVKILKKRYPRTISEVIGSAKVGDRLTDGKRRWKIINWEGDMIAIPLTKNSFELWANCQLEKTAVLPGLRILR